MRKYYFLIITMYTCLMGNSNGQNPNYLWAKSTDGVSSSVGYSCAADVSGNIIVTGWFNLPLVIFGSIVLTNAGGEDAYIVKYDPDGNVLWAQSSGGTSSDVSVSCSTDANGNIIATGYFQSPTIMFGTTVLSNTSGTFDMFIVKYDADGNVLWAQSAG